VVLRLARSSRWLGALALAATFAVAAFFLGRWQWGRYEERQARADRIVAHYDAAPVALPSVLGSEPLPLAREWTRVRATGRYAAGEPLLVRNRPLDGTYGYEVLVPLALDDGSTLLVDRGWVPNAESASARPEVPPAPGGPVEVTGWLRVSEESLDRDLPRGQLASINLGEARDVLGTPLLGGYLVLDEETSADGTAPPRPARLERPDTDIGPHQAYAFQWWLAMPVGFVLVYVGIRREHRDALEAAASGDAALAGAGRPPRAAKPRKVRIWDEEDA
jgi:cytochrome oxidase assembly protein ShyY1